MTATAFNISMVITSDVAAAKAGLGDVSTGLKAVSAEADKTSLATKQQAAELERLAVATAKAAMTQDDLAAAEQRAMEARRRAGAIVAPLANPTTSTSAVIGAWRGTETAAGSLQRAVAGLNASIGSQAHDMVEAAQATAIYNRALDDIRASFNPLFAASRQYEQQLERIAEAERLGAINAREAAAARAAAANQMAPMAGGMPGARGVGSHHTANVAAQGFDVGVTAAMGMNPAMIGIQQGPQLAQIAMSMGGGTQALKGIASGFLAILNPMNLAIIGMTAFAAYGIQALIKLGGETKSFEESMDALGSAVDGYEKNLSQSRMGTAELSREFGGAAEAVRGLLAEMAEMGELDRRAAKRAAKDAFGSLKSEIGLNLTPMPEGDWLSSGGSIQQAQNRGMAELNRESDMQGLRKVFGLDRSEASRGLISSVLDAAAVANSADDLGLDEQIAAAEALRAAWLAAAEAQGPISEKADEQLRQLQEAQQLLEKQRALEGNEAGTEAAKRLKGEIYQQVELERARLQYGEDAAEVRAIENRHEREALKLKSDALGLAETAFDRTRAMNALQALQDQREKAALDARREWFRDQDDKIGAIRLEISLIGASAAEQSRINALAEAEVEIRDRKMGLLEAVEARSKAILFAEHQIEATRKRSLLDLENAARMDVYDDRIASATNPWIRADIEAEKEFSRQMAEHGDETLANVAAQNARARAIRDVQRSQSDFFRDQEQGLAQMRLELALVGQTAEVRARVLALTQAEQKIASLGMSGQQADMVRQQALEGAELARVIGEQADAWERVQSAGEIAIDGVLDALRKGDVKDAMRGLLAEIGDGFFHLQVRNPLKNAILGTNLGTWEDVGGLGGIWGRLTGKNTIDEGALSKAGAMATATMTVTAGSVILGGNLSGIQPGIIGAANSNTMPMSFAGLGGSSDVQSQVWSFFAQKGLKPHQIAGIMGNIQAGSGFDPLAVGDGDDAFGLFQWNDRRHEMFNSIGGQQNLGDVQKQLEFAWHELMTTERAAMQGLLAAPDASSAADSFVRQFKRPADWAIQKTKGERSAAAEAAEQRFANMVTNTADQVGQLGSASVQAGQGMDNLGQGMDQFGGVLGGLLSGATGLMGGEKGGILGLLVGAGRQVAAGVPLFDRGGATAAGDPADPAGIVHKGEYVFDAITTRRIGVSNLDKMRAGVMRGFREGGQVAIGSGPRLPANFSGAPDQGVGGIRQVNVQMDVSGTGNSEIAAGVHAAIGQTLDQFVRDALPGQVKFIINDKWGG